MTLITKLIDEHNAVVQYAQESHHKDGFLDGMKKAIDIVKNHNGWISVDDPPTTDDFVFVLLHGVFPALGKYSNKMWEAQPLGASYMNLVDGARVTHWLPSPQPPEENQDD